MVLTALAVIVSTFVLIDTERVEVAAAAGGTIAGTVFNDRDSDGMLDPGEPGVPGVSVRAYGAGGGVVGSAFSGSDGVYSFSISSADTEVRIEFATPSGYQPSFVGGAGATSSGSSVQFVPVSSTGVNYAVLVPVDYCQNNPAIAAACLHPGGDTLNDDKVTLYRNGWESGSNAKLLNKAESGAVWGVAYQRRNRLVYTSAVVRRHAELGQAGIGGLYVSTLDGTRVAAFDLTSKGLALKAPGSDYSNFARGIGSAGFLSLDLVGFAGVGREGLGDIDITPDGRYLFVTNLYERKVHRIELTGTAAAPTLGDVATWSLTDTAPCSFAGSVARPFGLELFADGAVGVGVVCTNEAAVPDVANRPEKGVIMRLNPALSGAAAWGQLTSFSFDYDRALEVCPGSTPCPLAKWQTWSNDWFAMRAESQANTARGDIMTWPQPMIVDIETAADGSFVLGLNDRMSMQVGSNNLSPEPGNSIRLTSGWVAGDTLLLCRTPPFGWTRETGGDCGPNYSSSRSEGLFADSYLNYHLEQSIGGLAIHPSYGPQTVAFTAMDPLNFQQGGVVWDSLLNGDRTRAVAMMSGLDQPWSFGKSTSMGDLEVLCDSAPVQIGDRVWIDADTDGVQDPGEEPVEGVTVHLYNATGDRVGTAVTDAAGRYLFSSTVTSDADLTDHIGGGLTIGEAFTVRLDRPEDYEPNGPLFGYAMTAADRTAPNGAMTDAVDSDATVVAGSPRMSVSPLEPGANNHTFDAGFVPTFVSVGDTVWWDAEGDGVQGPTDRQLEGVTLTITRADGSPAFDVRGDLVTTTTTDASGRYSFDFLEPGYAYKVAVSPPPGFSPAPSGAGGDSALDSSTGEAVSNLLDVPGGRDDTLDFGFVADFVEVGDSVWRDTDEDGIQDANEPPAAGATVTLVDMDGNPVTDIFGDPVAPQVTGASGRYWFTRLPPGQYRVQITYPPGDGPTLPGQGADGGTDSSADEATSLDLPANSSDDTLDFGVVPVVSVGDYVWLDVNRDGVQDASDVPLQGVVLTITTETGDPVYNSKGELVTTTTTDATGRYSFDNLPFGSYTVTVTPPAGLVATASEADTSDVDSSTGSATSRDLQTNGDRDPTLDFGFVIPAVSVGDLVWWDRDADGVQDPTDAPVPLVALTITRADGSPALDIDGRPVEPTVTDAFGRYRFDNLQAGYAYRVSVTPPAGFEPTTPNVGDLAEDSSTGIAESRLLTVDGDRDATLDFGFVATFASVGDLVWRDLDGDGIRGSGEGPVEGAVLELIDDQGRPVENVLGEPVGPQTTGADGAYLFSYLPPGRYAVRITYPSGYGPTVPDAGDDPTVDSSAVEAVSRDLAANEVDTTLDFGVVPVVSVGDYVWLDVNRDGLQDATDVPLEGVVLTITTADGAPVIDSVGRLVTTTTSDASGRYTFDNLPFGSYKVAVTPPSRLVETVAGAGGDGAVDSSTGSATSRDLQVGGDRDPTLDFGFIVPSVSVGDFVWWDRDGDGLQSEGDVPLSGVTLTITRADGSPARDVDGKPVTSTTTDAAGLYSFDNLQGGYEYKVTVTTPPGFSATLPNVGADTGADSSTGSAVSALLTTDGQRDPTLDFGFVANFAELGDYVWFDADNDGLQDSDELPAPGVVLELFDAHGNPVTDVLGNPVPPQNTDAEGRYLFTLLPPGQYKVRITYPTGYHATLPGVGADRTIDSAIFEAVSVDLAANEADLTLDFGIVAVVSVGDYVFWDQDRDGIQDPTDLPIAGATLTITTVDGGQVYDTAGRLVTTTTTDADGRYSFDNLPFGSYKVAVTAPKGFLPTSAGTGGDPALDSSTGSAISRDLQTNGDRDPTLDFGFVPEPYVAVGSRIWLDGNGDGLQDPGERGVGGAVLTLRDMDGNPVTDIFGRSVGPIVTGPSGEYLFDLLPPGQYQVFCELPAGHTSTVAGAGSRDVDSSTRVAVSRVLAGGEQDPTLDFGAVPETEPVVPLPAPSGTTTTTPTPTTTPNVAPPAVRPVAPVPPRPAPQQRPPALLAFTGTGTAFMLLLVLVLAAPGLALTAASRRRRRT